jgi:polysaccharide pyruvyl transferase WcaK-like protein
MPGRDEIDAVIVNGEGSIHNSATRDRPHALAELAAFASEKYQAKSFLINSTFYNNEARLYEKLSKFTKVYVRDSASEREAKEFGLVTSVVPDLTLTYNYRAPWPARSGVGVTDSVIGGDSKRLFDLAVRNGFEFHRMVNSTHSAVHLLWSGQVSRAIEAIQRGDIFRDTTSVKSPSTEEFLRWLSSKELIITGRFHSVTLCLITRTPFVCVESNTPKISSLLKDCFESTTRMLDIQDIKGIAQFDFTQKEVEGLDSFLLRANSRATQMFDEIKISIKEG